MKKILKYLLSTIILVIIFIFSMYITGKIPRSTVEKHIEESVDYVVDYPFWKEAMTDAIMLDMVYRHDDKNSFYSSLRNITISN